jgi:hypothetical protein
MSNIPTWLVGTAVTAISITPLTVGSDGSLSAGSLASLTGHLDEINLEQVNDLENIVPMDERLNNEVITGSGTLLTLVEILAHSGGNILAGIVNAYDYVQASFSRGGKAYTGTFVVKGYSEGIRRGKSVGKLSLSPCGIVVTYA